MTKFYGKWISFNIYFLNDLTVHVVRAYISEHLAVSVLQIFKEGQEARANIGKAMLYTDYL
jgi:hypothetical protein